MKSDFHWINIRQQKTMRDKKQIRWALWLPQLTAWRKEPRKVLADSWVENIELGGHGSKVSRAQYQREEGYREREFWKSAEGLPWVFNWVWVGTWTWRKEHQRSLEGKIPRDHTGPRIVPIPSGKPKIYRGLGKILKRLLPQKWEKNSTRLHNTLISPNYT